MKIRYSRWNSFKIIKNPLHPFSSVRFLPSLEGKTKSAVTREHVMAYGCTQQSACTHSYTVKLRWERRQGRLLHTVAVSKPLTNRLEESQSIWQLATIYSHDCVCMTCPELTVWCWLPSMFNTEWVRDNSNCVCIMQNWIKGHSGAHDATLYITFFFQMNWSSRKFTVKKILSQVQ